MELRPPPVPSSATSRPRLGLLIALQALTLAALAAVLLWLFTGRHSGDGSTSQRARSVASELNAAGALDEAAAMYERYLDTTADASSARAAVAYSLGNIYLERGRYEKALRWLYEAEALGPGELEQEVASKIVHCLERLGRTHAARAALASRTRLEPPQAVRPADDAVVARIGAHEIRASDLQKALDDLPPELAARFAEPSGREALLRKVVADRLIFRKAQKLELDQDPDVRRRLDAVFEHLVVRAFVEKEILGKITPDATDLATFHEAHRDRYDQKAAARVRVIELATDAQARDLLARLSKGAEFAALAREHSLHPSGKQAGGRLDEWVEAGRDFLHTGETSIAEELVAASAGGVVGPLAAGKHVYLFEVEKIRPAAPRSFADVKQQVERDLRLAKMQAAYEKLITDELGAEDVELFPERLKQP